ncbi:hypothetical protein ACO0QE_001501 [Hanseniaspora vineae]
MSDTSYTFEDCYSSLPSSFTFSNSYTYQTPGWCSQQCVGSKYFALFNHGDCYCCDDDLDLSTLSTSDQCNAYCYGFSEQMCGGEQNAYDIYAYDTALTGQSSSIATTTLSSSTSSSSSTSTPTSTSSSTSSSSTSETSTTTSSTTSATSSTTSPITTTSTTSSITDDVVTSFVTSKVLYSTGLQTHGGSTVYVTQVVSTVISTATATADASKNGGSDSSASGSSGNSSSKKKVPVGPIVGGVVGGVCGLVVIVVCFIFVFKKINKKREEERLEREYQEAIKPRPFLGKSVSAFMGNTKGDGMARQSEYDVDKEGHSNNNSNSSNNNPFDNDAYVIQSNMSGHSDRSQSGEGNEGTVRNGVDKNDDTGSIVEGYTQKLTVVNPDN